MKRKNTRRFRNRLALFRRRTAIERKQLASLLGQRTTHQISRYERGIAVPSLRNALKLSQIYHIPIRVMLDGYYETIREEIRREGKERAPIDRMDEWDFCTIEEKLSSGSINKADLDKAYAHSAALIRQRAERLGHY